MAFEFATATRIIFGEGKVLLAGVLAAGYGKHVLLLTGHSKERAAPVMQALTAAGVDYVTFNIAHEPTTDLVAEGAAFARANDVDSVIGFGGGSVLDAGKAIAALLMNGGQPLDYLEVIGKGQPIRKASAPYIAIPTTAGTGAEVTRNAVLRSTERQVKVSLRSPLMLPRVAIVDPELTHSVPPSVTVSTGLDAFTQVVEPFVSHLANPLTDALCRDGIGRAARSLERVYTHGDDHEARHDMALVSLFGGLALANAKLGAVHGFAGTLGGMYDVPHGVICGRLLPFVIAANVKALKERETDNPAVARFDEIGVMLTGSTNATADDTVAWIQDVCAKLKVPGLATYGVNEVDFKTILAKSSRSSSMKGNPIKLTEGELREILLAAL